jgi:hypothetical protein
MSLRSWSLGGTLSDEQQQYYVPPDLAMQWWEETIEALETWCGRVKTNYVLPADKDHAATEMRV